MSEENPFTELIRRVRAGDGEAAAELVRRYEPTIRLVVRRRLTDPGLRRLLDSLDICQSVLARFFLEVSAGRFQLDTPEQLLSLLATMARNRLTSHARKQRAARRGAGRAPQEADGRTDCIDPGPSPSDVVIGQELLHEFDRRLSPEERRLRDLRAAGRSWEEIAGGVGGSPDGLRMRYTRTVARLARELGLDG